MAAALDPTNAANNPGPGSARVFGIVFAALFAIIGCWPLFGGAPPRWWSVALAAAFALPAFVAPGLLRPLNWLWHQFGLLLHKIVSLLLMGAIFFLCVTPIALIMRLLGKDVLALRRRDDLSTYWIARDTSGAAPEHMKRQF